jgi:hypothetical protein
LIANNATSRLMSPVSERSADNGTPKYDAVRSSPYTVNIISTSGSHPIFGSISSVVPGRRLTAPTTLSGSTRSPSSSMIARATTSPSSSTRRRCLTQVSLPSFSASNPARSSPRSTTARSGRPSSVTAPCSRTEQTLVP